MTSGTISNPMTVTDQMTLPGQKTILFVGRSGNGLTSCVTTIKTVITNTDLLPDECPGVGDTGEDRTKDLTAVLAEIVEKINKYNGIDAIVLVLKYGVRFTKQEKDAVAMVKSVFGKDIFKTRGILAFIYGDLYELDIGGDEEFPGWCKRQDGEIATLLNEVQYRCVLFNNKSENNADRAKTTSELIDCVLGIRKSVENKYRVGGFPMDSLLYASSSYVKQNGKSKSSEELLTFEMWHSFRTVCFCLCYDKFVKVAYCKGSESDKFEIYLNSSEMVVNKIHCWLCLKKKCQNVKLRQLNLSR